MIWAGECFCGFALSVCVCYLLANKWAPAEHECSPARILMASSRACSASCQARASETQLEATEPNQLALQVSRQSASSTGAPEHNCWPADNIKLNYRASSAAQQRSQEHASGRAGERPKVHLRPLGVVRVAHRRPGGSCALSSSLGTPHNWA